MLCVASQHAGLIRPAQRGQFPVRGFPEAFQAAEAALDFSTAPAAHNKFNCWVVA